LVEESDERTGKLIETACVVATGAKFFWRDKYKNEVDIVLLKDGGIIPIEIKYRNRPRQNKGMEKFLKKYKCKEAFMITKDARKEAKDADGIEWIPVHEFLLRM
jgi:hypothetical protein